MYREPPPPQFNHLVLGGFAPSMGKTNWMCDVLRSGGVYVQDCEAAWRERWDEFWRQAIPQYDHLLVWDATPEARALIPTTAYRPVFEQDKLAIFERIPAEAHASNLSAGRQAGDRSAAREGDDSDVPQASAP